MTDFTFVNHGSITVLTPLTEAGSEWLDEHTPSAQTWCGGIVIEPRYTGAILEGLADDGLTVEEV